MIAQPSVTKHDKRSTNVDQQMPRVQNALGLCCDTCQQLAQQLKAVPSTDLFFNFLVDDEQYLPAIRFAGHWLPKRKAIWWAVVSVWWQIRETGTTQELAVVDTVIEWVLDPTDELRRQAGKLADGLPRKSPVALVGLAVFWSGGSVAPVDCQPVNPPEQLAGHFATSAVIAAVGYLPAKQRQALRFAAETRYTEVPWAADTTAEGA